MKIFTTLYQKMLYWSRHRHALFYLCVLSFAESSCFPIPPDFMLAPMALAQPTCAWRYALYTTLSSVLGGIFGYILGYFFMTLLMPYLGSYATTFQHIEHDFKRWGFWIMFVAGFAPIPYKLFTLAAGALKIPLIPFVLGSAIGRGGRFFLVCGLIRWRGMVIEQWLLKYIEYCGWLLTLGLIMTIVFYHYHSHDIISTFIQR